MSQAKIFMIRGRLPSTMESYVASRTSKFFSCPCERQYNKFMRLGKVNSSRHNHSYKHSDGYSSIRSLNSRRTSLRQLPRNQRRDSSDLKSTSESGSARGGTTRSIGSILSELRQALHAALLQPRTVPIPRWITPRHFSITLSECLGHSSFILVAVSYATDDFLLLRTIAVAGSTSMLFFTYFHPHGRPLMLPLKWNVLFILINSWRIGTLFYEKHLAQQMDDYLKKIREDHFHIVDPVDFYKLVTLADTEVFESGDLIVGQGQMNRYIRLIIDGEIEILRDGVLTYSLGEGNFVSESGLHAGLLLPGSVESNCSIIAKREEYSDDKSVGKVKVLRWDRTELMDLLNNNKGLRRSLKVTLSWDIIRKLKGQRQLLIEHKVSDPELWTQKRNEQNEVRYAAILQNMLQHPDSFKKSGWVLDKYRIIHNIDDEHHCWALKKCGWTLEEYEAGQKFHHKDVDGMADDNEDTIGSVKKGSSIQNLREKIFHFVSRVFNW